VDHSIEREARRYWLGAGQPELSISGRTVDTVVDAPISISNTPPPLGKVNCSFGITVEHAAENKVAGGDGGVERKAQQV